MQQTKVPNPIQPSDINAGNIFCTPDGFDSKEAAGAASLMVIDWQKMGSWVTLREDQILATGTPGLRKLLTAGYIVKGVEGYSPSPDFISRCFTVSSSDSVV